MTKIISIIALSFLLTNCSVYKLDVQQGNAISQEATSQLRKGMSKGEVASLLGNPLLQDNFRSDRWDYVYFTSKGGKPKQKQNITVFFKNGQLVSVKK